MIRRIRNGWRTLCLIGLALLIAACGAYEGTFEVAIEQKSPPAEPVNWQATAVALATENARLAGELRAASSGIGEQVVAAAEVAYIQGGDLWVKSLPDGEARRLTHDGRNRQPRWSASGEWLAYLKGGDFPQLWLMRRNGEDAQMIIDAQSGAEFAWSPSADVLAYVSGDGIALWRPDTATSTPLVTKEMPQSPPEPPLPPEAAGMGAGHLAWSPDGSWLAYEWSTWDTAAEQMRHGIWTIGMGGGEPIQRYDSGLPKRGQALLAGWTGDGRYILFWQSPIMSASMLADGVPLYALPAGGGEAQLLAEPVLVHQDFVVPHPGEQPTVALVVGSYRATWTGKQLRVVALGAEAVQPPLDQAISSPAWAPNGATLAFVAMPDEGDLGGGPDAQAGLMERRIWLWEVGHAAPSQLTNEPGDRDERPQWVDDQRLLFARLDTEGRASLWLVDSVRGGAQQVVDELTPAPEWFGYYGYINWDELFAVWTPPASPHSATQELLPTVASPAGTPTPVVVPADAPGDSPTATPLPPTVPPPTAPEGSPTATATPIPVATARPVG
jgi:Tol biopolymer transport system component